MVLVILFRSYVFEKQFINNNIMSAIAYPIEPWKIPFIMDVPFFHVTFTVLGMTQMKIIVHSLITNFPHENLDTLIFLLLRWAYKCRIMCSPYTWGLPALWWLCINKNLSQQHGYSARAYFTLCSLKTGLLIKIFVTHWFSNTWPLNIILNRLILPQTTFPSSGLGKWSQVNLMISHSGPQAAKLTSYKYVISDIESNFGVAWNQAHWSGDGGPTTELVCDDF